MWVCARHALAASVSQLNEGFCAIAMDFLDKALKTLDELIVPNAEVFIGDASFRAYGGRFDDDHSDTAHSTTAVMGKVKGLDKAVYS